jgi:hypothetical protein
LFDESYVCALRADHPDAKASALSIDRFCALDHALVSFAGERHERTHSDPGHQWARALLIETCGALDGAEEQSVRRFQQSASGS